MLLLVVWGLVATRATSQFFPGPLTIAEAFVDTWVGPAFVEDVLPSLYRLGIGITASIVLGVAAGTVIGLVHWLRELLEPLLEFFRAIPPPVLIPVMMLLLGITDTMKVVVIVSGAVWPILLNTIEGVRATDSVMKETADAFRITWSERLWFLVLPAASPRIMAGVRQGLSVALILMVISEMFASSSGLGYRIAYFQRNYLIAEMWSGILLLGLVGVFLAVVFGLVERRVLRWYHGIREVNRA
ncbi:ABC transporter permease [Micromonospora sp. KC213]|nr:ABC transporter permease [Micromonospora sp. KC213]